MNEVWNVKKVSEDVWHIDESGLNAMYLVKGKKMAAVIDTGTGIGDFRKKLEEILGMPYIVIITHGHMDHAGGIGQFENIYIHPDDMEAARKITLEDRIGYIERMESAGAIAKDKVFIEACMKNDKKPEMLPLNDGDIIELGDKQLEIFAFPGHTNGSVCILDRKDRVLFSGDNMNDIELITGSAHDRTQLLEQWYSAGAALMKHRTEYDVCCGGHGIFSPEKAENTLICGKLALEQRISPQRMKIHFFDADFYEYNGSWLYNGEFKDLY